MSKYQLFDPDTLFDGLIERLEQRNVNRAGIGSASAAPLRHAKKAIFALQRRTDIDAAQVELLASRDGLAELQEKFGAEGHGLHGQWRVAVEEFLEALFFLQFYQGRPLDLENDPLVSYGKDPERKHLRFEDDEVFGALSDFSGEAYRQMQLWISEGNIDEALRAHRTIARVAELLNQNTSGGSLRNKVDQANRNLHNADARVTDLKLRGLL